MYVLIHCLPFGKLIPVTIILYMDSNLANGQISKLNCNVTSSVPLTSGDIKTVGSAITSDGLHTTPRHTTQNSSVFFSLAE